MPLTLQLLHASDFEGGVPAAGTSPQTSDAVNFSAVINRLRTDTTGSFGVNSTVLANTLTLSSGDNYLPGPFFNASSDPSLNGVGGLGTSNAAVLGRGDIGILNALGIQASALGNHEFDLGIRQVRDILRTGSGNPGTNFPYLSTNLDFGPEIASTQGNLAASDLATNPTTAEASTIKGKIAQSTVITVAGNDGVIGTTDDQKIGVVGATTPLLRSLSSPGLVGIKPGNPVDYAALATEIQTTVDTLTSTGINKVILLAHMQQFEIELNELAPRLKDVDVIMAGGSHSLFASGTNPTPLRSGDTAVSAYPTLRTSANGQPVLVINTPANYRYVGRLVVDFDDNGVVLPSSINPNITGAYATDQAGLNTLFGAAPGTNIDGSQFADPRVVSITNGIRSVISGKDNTLFGNTSVFLNGTRTDVRTRETNFGNLTADANLAIARQIDPTVVISLKNGGGIRDNIGNVTAAPGATNPNDVLRLPPQPTALSPNKPVGGVSQLDVENSLRFNNTLSLVTVTATQLKDIMEHAVAATATGATPGQFPQLGGLSIGYNPAGAARTAVGTGNRIVSIAIADQNGKFTDVVVQNGQIVGDPSRSFRMVTLNFLAGGGDGYPLTTATNRVDLAQVGAPRTGTATFADNGTEQDAFAEFLAGKFPTAANAFNTGDVGQDQSQRVRNIGAILDGLGGQKTFAISQGEGSRAIANFGGVDSGSSTEVDVLRVRGGGDLSAESMILSQSGSNALISFEDVPNTEIRLENFNIANLGNPVSGQGNIIFNDEIQTQPIFEVVSESFTSGNISTPNFVTFLNNNDNFVAGTNTGDVINAQGGNDFVVGGAGKDLLRGGAGNDTLLGGIDDDSLMGAEGDDFIFAEEGNDTISSGAGNDTLFGGIGNDVATAGDGNDAVGGNEGNDTLDGGSGNDHIVGGADNDVINGGEGIGNDALYGEAGNDLLNGGNDSDLLVGGIGSDDFVFGGTGLPFRNIGIDTVLDFALEDRLALSKGTFTGLLSALGDGFSVANEFAAVTSNADTSSALIVYDSSIGYLYYNPDGSTAGFGDGGLFAVMNRAQSTTLANTNFRLSA
jgi:2',3'-cyclic-nucleotide 2'-phosphodiesterase (5'-nucleotidase family)